MTLTYNNQQLLQQMPELPFPINKLLREIGILLQDWNPNYKDCSRLFRDKIMFVLEKIQSIQLCKKSTLSLILQNKHIQSQLKRQLYSRLRNTVSKEKFIEKYRVQASKSKETYFFIESNYNNLIKEILQNIKAIEEETDKLITSLKSFDQNYFDHTSELYDHQIQSLEIDYLLRVVMENTQLQLDNSVDSMLFRLFILQESISLILQKTDYVINQIIAKQQTTEPTNDKTEAGSNTKRSALSQSLQIYKMKNLKQAKVQEERIEQATKEQKTIKTDYLMQRKPEKKLHRSEKLSNCCFGF